MKQKRIKIKKDHNDQDQKNIKSIVGCKNNCARDCHFCRSCKGKLELKNLHIEVDGKKIIKGVSLTFCPNKVHVLMGPNGSGKSTLANALMGHPNYKITKGKIILDGKDITHEKSDIRAKLGLFLSFQNPVEIGGVTVSSFLRAAMNATRTFRGEKELSVMDFYQKLKITMKKLKLDDSFSNRYLNEGFSGGEKKRLEMLQMLLLEPKYSILDETDSGLDVDAIRTVAKSINEIKKELDMGVILITHYAKFLKYLNPDDVSVMVNGKIILTGGPKIADRIEKEGFEKIIAGK
jgi:Fe-S cluster assembly ATP-binding protein